METVMDVGDFVFRNLARDTINQETSKLWHNNVTPLLTHIPGQNLIEAVPPCITNIPKKMVQRQIKNRVFKEVGPAVANAVIKVAGPHKIEESIDVSSTTVTDTVSYFSQAMNEIEHGEIETATETSSASLVMNALGSSTVSMGLMGGPAGAAVGALCDIAAYTTGGALTSAIIDPIWQNTVTKATRYIISDETMEKIPVLLSKAPCKALKRTVSKHLTVPAIKYAASVAIKNPWLAVASLAAVSVGAAISKISNDKPKHGKGVLHITRGSKTLKRRKIPPKKYANIHTLQSIQTSVDG